MTYLKLLTALTALALLTACGGATPTATKTDDGDNNTIIALTCTQNPFGATCTAPTPTEAKAFCSDASKPTTTKANDCADTVIRVCGENPYDAGLCIDNNDYTNARQLIRLTCTNTDDNLRDELCPTAVATECTTDPFLAVCRLGTAGADDGTYGLERATQILATCAGENGEGFGNVFDPKCSDVEPYQTEKDRITSECEGGGGNTNTCPPDVVVQVCLGNPYNTALCNDPAIDYTTQRMERLTACKGNNRLAGCADAAATTCPMNPFQAGICFIGTTYMSQRDSETLACRGTPNGANCGDAQTAVCTLNVFDAFCKDVALFIDAQIDGCADATATTAQCNVLFATELAGCLENPFSEGCDAEPTFADDKVSVRTSRYNFCAISQNEPDARCAGYRTCNNNLVFAPLTCGADFQPVRMAFCMTTANAFDPLCVDNNLTDATAQLEYCKLSTANLFGTDCKKDAFTQARIEFCMDTPDNDDCRADLRGENLMSVTDPCADGACVDVADLPYPTTPAERSPTAGDDFADGFLNVKLIAPTDGVLLNPNGTENSTIDTTDTTNFPATTRLEEKSLRFGRRGGRGSSDADGFVWFSILKGATGTESSQRSNHAAILPTTNLGAPLASPPMNALWPGHFYTSANTYSTDFYVTFDGTTGAIGFANPTKDGIGTGADRPTFAKTTGIKLQDITFGADGVLSGNIIPANFVPAQPTTGLIGTEGAVGVLVGASNVSAGFTATNPDGGAVPSVDACIADPDTCFVTYKNWVDATSVTRVGIPTENTFTTTSNRRLLTSSSGFTNNATNLDTAQFGGVALGGDVDNGFIVANVSLSFYLAGIRSTTNLGLPLEAQPTGTWNGSFQVYEDADNSPVDSDDFTLTVTYGGASEGKAGSVSATIANTDYSFVGEFNASGVIDGTVTHTDATNGNSTGELQGLIGVRGAVGVFINNADTPLSYGGGFVACPYNTTTNKCTTSR